MVFVNVIGRFHKTRHAAAVETTPLELVGHHAAPLRLRLQRVGQLNLAVGTRFGLGDDVDLALQGVDFTPFTLALNGTGLFGTLKKPRLVWAGVAPTAPLVALERKLEAALTRIGLPAETRKYSPHITLARLDRNASRLDRFLEASGSLTSQDWSVDHFTLFRSHLGHTGAHYEVLARYPSPGTDSS